MGWGGGGTNTHHGVSTNNMNTTSIRRRRPIPSEVLQTHQVSTTVVNVEEVNRLKRVLKDLEDKQKALRLLGKLNPRLLPEEVPGETTAKLIELKEMLRQNLLTREEYETSRKKVIEALGKPQ